ncbi:hypothetical protein EG329_005489 [Mollisiaceae sp. DMI_Dod_QoI]|nr:hypothetical protein EG329_005489 [Helotiales sp. DMI_Dod_QoI]
MGCVNSKTFDPAKGESGNDGSFRDTDIRQKDTSVDSVTPSRNSTPAKNGETPEHVWPALGGPLPGNSFASAPTGSTEQKSYEYLSQKSLIVAKAIDHQLTAEDVEQKLHALRAELAAHDNENATDQEREWFIEKRCWETLMPDEHDFPGRRPNRSKKATFQEVAREIGIKFACNGCVGSVALKKDCPWVRTESCHVPMHNTFKVRLGEEKWMTCPECKAEESPAAGAEAAST